ncbi:MAG: hypothetical protein RLZZ578_1124 [Bacteroidota bacterium]
MNISEYEQIQYAIQVRDINLACSCMNSLYIQAIIDANKEVELNEQLVKLFALLDNVQTVTFTSDLLTPQIVSSLPKGTLDAVANVIHQIFEEEKGSENTECIEQTIYLLLILSVGNKTGIQFYDHLTFAETYFANKNAIDKFLEFLDNKLSQYEISNLRYSYSFHFLKARLTFSLTRYQASISEYEKAGEYALQLDDYSRLATCNESIGVTYGVIGNYSLQLHYHVLAKSIREEHKIYDLIGNSYINIGLCYMNLGDKQKAKEYYEQGIVYQVQNQLNYDIAIGKLLLSKVIDHPDERLQLLQESLDIFTVCNDMYRCAEANIDLGITYIQMELYQQADECLDKAHLFLQDKSKDPIRGLLYKVYAQLYFPISSQFHDESLAEEYIIKAIDTFIELEIKDYAFQALEDYAGMLEKQERWKEHSKIYKDFHSLQQEVLNAEVQSKIQAFEFMQQKEREDHDRKLQQVKYQEQEKLLHSILPSQIAAKIVDGQSLIAESAESVSVFFMDIVDFTDISIHLSPTLLLNGLNEIFSDIDQLADQHAVEKIKTIGDAYMAVASIPNHDPDHAFNMSSFALDVLDRSKFWKLGETHIAVRIGIHVGPVVGGVIGKQRFTYDVWGDTVNIASRLESTCEPHRIQISQDLKRLLDGHPEFICKNRGEITLKGRGILHTYWLSRNPSER